MSSDEPIHVSKNIGIEKWNSAKREFLFLMYINPLYEANIAMSKKRISII